MNKRVFYLLGLVLLAITSCRRNDDEVEIPDFNFPQTVVFEDSLSAYEIFEGAPSNLSPTADFEPLVLSSSLFTDYAHKQRLVKVPDGTKLTRKIDGSLDFPDGTILTKTFFYYNDDRDTSLGKQIIETRLEIKEAGTWNIATYLWNQAQTAATLKLDGNETQVTWISSEGRTLSTVYHVPTQNECMTCHQSNSAMAPIGPTLLNLNQEVQRNGNAMNQLSHMQSIGILNDFPVEQTPKMVDYKDLSKSIVERGRSYLAINCAHCHNPNAWDIPAEKDFDFRYETSLQGSGIENGKDRISRNMIDQEMPFLGTTMLDEEGVALILAYLETL